MSSENNNICTLNTQNLSPPLSLSVSSDDFFVDQLLNFNNDDGNYVEDEVFVVTESSDANKVSPFCSASFDFDLTGVDFGSVLSVPAEEADLEWLSHFVEDSFSQFTPPYPADVIKPEPKPKPEPEPGTSRASSISTPSPANKARRSKRARTGGRVWTTPLPDSTATSSPGPTGGARRCTHCGAQRTPQWRCGPRGPKSLCNACGVRYKSGRLLPEYRPACSPTFSSELHSNSHRKVLEMRRKKEGRVEPPGLAHPVSSFG